MQSTIYNFKELTSAVDAGLHQWFNDTGVVIAEMVIVGSYNFV